MTSPEVDNRSPARKALDERIAAEPQLRHRSCQSKRRASPGTLLARLRRRRESALNMPIYRVLVEAAKTGDTKFYTELAPLAGLICPNPRTAQNWAKYLVQSPSTKTSRAAHCFLRL